MWYARIFVMLSLVMCCSVNCSGMLYYPDHVMYVETDMMEFKPEDRVLKIESGAEVHGWYFSAKEKPKGVILFFHGNGQNRTSHIVEVYWLVKEGYDLFAIEYPGYGETDGVPTPENTVQSGHAALRHLMQRNPNLPIIVYGQSLGGVVALRSVLDLKNEVPVKFVAISSSFLSYQKVGQKVLSKSWVTWLFQWLPWVVLSDKYAPKDLVKNLTPTPLLVIHHKQDPIVPYQLGLELFERASEPKQMWTLDGTEHNQIFTGEKGLLLRKKFLQKLSEI